MDSRKHTIDNQSVLPHARHLSALKTSGLSIHILNYDIIYLSYRCAIFKYLPWFICMKMNLYRIVIAYRDTAVSLEVFRDVISDIIFIKILAIDKKLCIVSEL